MSYLSPQSQSSFDRARGALKPRWGVALCYGVLAVLLLAHLRFRPRAEQPFDTPGWTLSDFLEHLRQEGVQLYLVPSAQDGRPGAAAYLTEDPAATWDSLHHKARMVERINRWQGTVFVERVGDYYSDSAVEHDLAKWGPYGRRIGDFVLFGDERLLQRIQEACR